jgi:hypothetical protein
MSKRSRVTTDTFAMLADREFKTTVLKRKQAFFIRDKYAVLVPSVLWKNQVGKGQFEIVGNIADGDSAMYPEIDTTVTASLPNNAPVNANGVDLKGELFNGMKVFRTPKEHSLIPERDPDFVAWGNFALTKKLLSSKEFMSIYVVGETGNGKTFNFEQAAAQLKKEIITVSFTAETDEDDLIGGIRLFSGETVYVVGPVIEAMERGAILLLDEVDLSSESVMALQSVLQGKPYFVKKLGRLVSPAPGFKVVATANTRGDGNADKYVFTNQMNGAFLDRFKVTLEQEYPNVSVEKKILSTYMQNHNGKVDTAWISDAVKFAGIIRNSYKEGILDDQVSTRRLVDMTMLYGILGSAKEAVALATNRFAKETQSAMNILWDTLDSTPDPDAGDDADNEEAFEGSETEVQF